MIDILIFTLVIIGLMSLSGIRSFVIKILTYYMEEFVYMWNELIVKICLKVEKY